VSGIATPPWQRGITPISVDELRRRVQRADGALAARELRPDREPEDELSSSGVFTPEGVAWLRRRHPAR
jgi:hypothetical protein